MRIEEYTPAESDGGTIEAHSGLAPVQDIFPYHAINAIYIHANQLFYQLVNPRSRSNPPRNCDPGLSTLPCKTVYLMIFSHSSGRTRASQIPCAAPSSGLSAASVFAWFLFLYHSKSRRRYTITLAEYLCPPTWLMKYIPTPPGRVSSMSR